MDTRKQRNYYRDYYMEGNTARNLQSVPNYPEIEQEKIQKPVRKVRRRPQANAGMDLVSLFFLTIAIAVTLYTCVEYLGVQSGITQMDKQIVELESQRIKIQDENNAALSQLNTALDLNYIYQVATNELGMVYPNENQVITYESNLSDYVRQYKDIPQANNKSLLEKIMN